MVRGHLQLHACKRAFARACKRAFTQSCKCVGLQTCKLANARVCNRASVQGVSDAGPARGRGARRRRPGRPRPGGPFACDSARPAGVAPPTATERDARARRAHVERRGRERCRKPRFRRRGGSGADPSDPPGRLLRRLLALKRAFARACKRAKTQWEGVAKEKPPHQGGAAKPICKIVLNLERWSSPGDAPCPRG